ncbi:MAG: hypothetical protein HRT57_17590 [Crocinitomicaceae bacterium]|nr:hypothetical protein [Crocinitomicaceae bacterium]
MTDTIERIIYNNLDLNEVKSVKEEESFELIVMFDPEGEITHISGNYGDESPRLESIIMEVANRSLNDFPQVMKVNHELYSPPVIRIWFMGHCLKYPEDKEYGCDDYRELIAPKKEVKTEKHDKAEGSTTWMFGLVGILAVISSIGIVLKRRKIK